MTWSESVDEALCFGWIDGVRKRIDDESYQIRFTPRRPGSAWSRINVAKVGQLVAQGRMRQAGMSAFQARSDSKTGIHSFEQERPGSISAMLRPATGRRAPTGSSARSSRRPGRAAWRSSSRPVPRSGAC